MIFLNQYPFMFMDDTKIIHPIPTVGDHDHLQADLNHLLQ